MLNVLADQIRYQAYGVSVLKIFWLSFELFERTLWINYVQIPKGIIGHTTPAGTLEKKFAFLRELLNKPENKADQPFWFLLDELWT